MAHNLGIKLYKQSLQGHGFLIAQNTIAVVVVALLHGQRYNKQQLLQRVFLRMLAFFQSRPVDLLQMKRAYLV